MLFDSHVQTCGDGEAMQAVVYTVFRSLGLRSRGLVDLEDEEEEAVSVILPEKDTCKCYMVSRTAISFTSVQQVGNNDVKNGANGPFVRTSCKF